jgi:hypothetical protein
MPDPNYMAAIQEELKWSMRSVLVDWIVDTHHKWRLLPETLYLAINITDRFLSKRLVSVQKLQLVGVSALLIASKFEEVVSPTVESFVAMTNNAYDTKEILKAECYVLHVLDYNLSYPSPMNFLRRGSKADNYDFKNRTFAKYLMEICLLDEKFLCFPGSLIAASALYLAKTMLQPTFEWVASA